MSGRLEVLITSGCLCSTHKEYVFTQWLTAQLAQAIGHHLAAIKFISDPEVRLSIFLDERNVWNRETAEARPTLKTSWYRYSVHLVVAALWLLRPWNTQGTS